MFKTLTFSAVLVLAMASWGILWPLSKILIQYLNPLELISLRFILATLAFIPLLFIFKISLKIPRDSLQILGVAALLNIIYAMLCFVGLNFGDAGLAGVIITTLSPILASILSVFIFKTKLLRHQKIGLFFGVIGGAFLIDSPHNLLELYTLIFLAAAFFWCCVTLITKEATQKIKSIVLNFYTSAIMGVVFLPAFFVDFSVLGGSVFNDFLEIDLTFYICIFVVSVISTTFGTTLFFKGIDVLGVARGGSFTLLVPLFALIFSFFILDEVPTISTIIGGTFAVFAIYLINKK